MRPSQLAGTLLLAVSLYCAEARAWGHRGHAAIDRAAVQALPDDGPTYLRQYVDVIAEGATIPDGWRGEGEPFLKIEEDPNHGWFRERFAFMQEPPRSRYAFVLALYDEQRRLAQTDPEQARRMNVRWTGTLPYAAVEGYERVVTSMRQIRARQAKGLDTREAERTSAFYVSWFAHYIGDGAQPMHASIHCEGWVGDNPNGYTRDGAIHGKVESRYVEKIGLTAEQLPAHMPALAHQDGDVFEQILGFLDTGRGRVEQMFRLEKEGAFDDPDSVPARTMIYTTAGDGAAMLRDLLVRAWRQSALPRAASPSPPSMSPDHPDYDPATGSAPAARSPAH